ncbi:MAG: hypothetical protein ACQER9_04365 [Nanobdellota archaeon]
MTRFIDEEIHFYDQAVDELKRVDHLVFVSLKYTRTVDVIKNILERMIESFQKIIDGLLSNAEEKKMIFQVPTSPGAKVTELRKLYPNNKELNELISFYLFLRKLHAAEYTATREFRRDVTMTATFPDGNVEEVNIDIISGYYERCKKLIENIKSICTTVESS